MMKNIPPNPYTEKESMSPELPNSYPELERKTEKVQNPIILEPLPLSV